MTETKKCSPRCNKFKCGKGFLTFHGKTPWCRWTDEPCNPVNCNYAMCVGRRLLPGGVCGETLRRRTVDKSPEEVQIPSIKVRGKVFRKIGEKELF